MKKILNVLLSVSGLVLIFSSPLALSQVVDVGQCRDIEDRLARFDCYEGLGGSEESEPESTQSSRGTQAEPRALSAQEQRTRSGLPVFRRLFSPESDVSEAPEDEPFDDADFTQPDSNDGISNFGRSDSSSARIVESEDGEELIDTIAELDYWGPQMWSITLESGQIWQQMLGKRFNLKVGDEVTISPSRWGESFRLRSEGLSGYIQVERAE